MFWPFPPPPEGGRFKLKNRENFEGGRKGKGRKEEKKKRVIKYLYEA